LHCTRPTPGKRLFLKLSRNSIIKKIRKNSVTSNEERQMTAYPPDLYAILNYDKKFDTTQRMLTQSHLTDIQMHTLGYTATSQ
jgi:Zn-finger domain-containing protein